MRTTRFFMNLCSGLLLSSGMTILIAKPADAQGIRMMTVLGSIEGTADGTERAWLTIAGEAEGEPMSSAAWRPYSMPNMMEGAFAGMSDAARAQMEERMKLMSEMMGEGANNPLTQMFGGGSDDQVQLRIMGVDPEAERVLLQGGLTIELPPFSFDSTDQILSGRNEAEISYHKNFGESTGFYASSHDVGTTATVAFDRLEIVDGGGFAAGTFEATLCPISALINNVPDPEVCILVAGQFETELGEEAADMSTTPTSN
jgi:hypothetical protein